MTKQIHLMRRRRERVMDDALRFYQHFEFFKPLEDGENKLYVPMRLVKGLVI